MEGGSSKGPGDGLTVPDGAIPKANSATCKSRLIQRQLVQRNHVGAN